MHPKVRTSPTIRMDGGRIKECPDAHGSVPRRETATPTSIAI
jgi:hypothetical protein